jgi:hypothetical protein
LGVDGFGDVNKELQSCDALLKRRSMIVFGDDVDLGEEMFFVLFCFVLFCFVLFCFVLFCFVFLRKGKKWTLILPARSRSI